jgi:WD40 repeat protein
LFNLASFTQFASWAPVKFLNSGTLLAAPVSSTKVAVWNVYTGQVLFNLTTGLFSLEQLANGYLATTGENNLIQTWNLTSGTLVGQASLDATHWVLKQTPIESYLASGSNNGNIYLWNIDSLTLVATLTGHTMKVDLLDVTPSGVLLSGSADNSVRIWNLTTLTCLSALSNALPTSSIMYQLRALSNTQLVIGGVTNILQFIAISSDNVLSRNGSLPLVNSNSKSYDFRVTTVKMSLSF